MALPQRNETSALEHAFAELGSCMEAAQRSRSSLKEIRDRERSVLREFLQQEERCFRNDPTLTLGHRHSHGEHTVSFDPDTGCWWKVTHPGCCGIGADFQHQLMPPYQVEGLSARELLPSEYLARLILQNDEFGDDVRLEGYVDTPSPSLLISQPDISGTPATAEEMTSQMRKLEYQLLDQVSIGRTGSISFYNPSSRIAAFDAHPGNFIHTPTMTFLIDGLLQKISHESEHLWLSNHLIESSI